MKKVLSLIMVMAMVLSLGAYAFAEAVSTGSSSPVDEVVVTPDADDEDIVVTAYVDDIVETELAKLAAAESASEYFGIEVNGEVVEFVGLKVSGMEDVGDAVVLKIDTPSNLEDGDDVTVLFGLSNEGDFDWTAFEGDVADGVVEVTVSAEYALEMQEAETVLMAICA